MQPSKHSSSNKTTHTFLTPTACPQSKKASIQIPWHLFIELLGAPPKDMTHHALYYHTSSLIHTSENTQNPTYWMVTEWYKYWTNVSHPVPLSHQPAQDN